MIHSGVQDGDGDLDLMLVLASAGEDQITIHLILTWVMVAFSTHSGAAMLGDLLGEHGVDQFTLLDRSLSFKEAKTVDVMWCMAQDLVVVHPWTTVLAV